MLGAGVTEISLGCTEIAPVRLRLHTGANRRDERALDAEQLLNETLRLLVASFAEMVIADDPLRVDEVHRRPVVVVESGPDRVVVVHGDRVVDAPRHCRLLHAVDLLLKRKLRRVDAYNDESVVSVSLGPRPYVGFRAQPIDAGKSPEVHKGNVAAQLGGAQRLGVKPGRGSGERWHAQALERVHLAKAPECDIRQFRELDRERPHRPPVVPMDMWSPWL